MSTVSWPPGFVLLQLPLLTVYSCPPPLKAPRLTLVLQYMLLSPLASIFGLVCQRFCPLDVFAIWQSKSRSQPTVLTLSINPRSSLLITFLSVYYLYREQCSGNCIMLYHVILVRV